MPESNGKVTSVAEWRSATPSPQGGFIVDLPSGRRVRMKRTMDMLALVRQGRVPNPLAAMVKEMIDKKEVNLDLKSLDPDSAIAMLDMIDSCVASAVLEPKIVLPDPNDPQWSPPEDALSVEEVPYEDRFFIYTVAQGGATDLQSFRAESERLMASVQDEPRVPSKTKRASGARKR